MSSPINSSQWMYASGGFYGHEISNSLRFDDGDSAKLVIDPTQDGDKQKWTWSGWVKRATLGLDYAVIFSGNNSSGHQTDIRFEGEDTIRLITATSALSMNVITTRLFRDISSWYHIVVAIDTTQSTLTDRFKVYVNGVQETSFSATTCTQNHNCVINTASSVTHNVGANGYNTSVSSEFDGYLAEVHFVDGTQYAASEFGETKDGVWIPKSPSVTYGTNGFHMKFDQTGTSANSSGIGADSSGNDHHFTVINLVASDIMPDSPTSNWTTLNPLTQGSSDLTTEGNLKCANFFDSDLSGRCATFYPDSGKWYWEVRVQGVSTYPYIGITDQLLTNRYAGGASWGSYLSIAWRPNGAAVESGSGLGTITKENIPSFGNGNILGFALDAAARKLWVAEDNTWADSGDPANGTGENASWTLTRNVTPFISGYQAQGDNTHFNFGQDSTFSGAISAGGNADGNGIGDFAYAPPAGFLAMASPNLPDITIGPGQTSQADDYFNTVLYTGDGASSNAITGVGFQPDWVWLKSRSAATIHNLFDSLRGTKLLQSAAGDAQQDNANYLTAYGTDGFTVGNSSNVNASSATFVSWNWKAGGTPSGDNSAANNAEPTAGSAKIDGSNQSGAFSGSPSIAIKRLSASTTAGFSIVQWTGTGSAGTIPHGLGAAPDFYVVKNLTDDGTSWQAYHRGIASDAETDYIYLNSTAAADDSDDWNDTAPTANVFSVKTHNQVNASGDEYLAYLFTSIEGYSKFGKYQGRANANGMFVFTGFRPAWLMIKNKDASGSWIIFDNTREGGVSNIVNDHLMADTTADEGTDSDIDILSNGFKNRRSSTSFNSAHEFIYLAFADQPFKFANAR